MNRFSPIFSAFTLAILVLLSSCSFEPICKRASGELETRSFDVSSISGLDLSGSSDVILQRGQTQSLEIEMPADVFEDLELEVISGVLHVDLKGCYVNGFTQNIYLTITEPLSSIDVSGAATVLGEGSIEADSKLDIDISGSGEIDLDLMAQEIETNISGSGEVDLRGIASEHQLRVSGSGDLKAFDLKTEEYQINVSGSGFAEVFATESLDVKVSGSGDVIYRGNPASITTDISGSGSVRPE